MAELHDAPSRPPRPKRKQRVRVLIVLASLVFVLAQVLLYWKWATTTVPGSILIVLSPEYLRGAEVSVIGLGLPQPYVATIGEGERFGIPFHLDPGRYSVAVTMHEQKLFEGEVEVPPRGGIRLDLTQLDLPPLPAPPMAPASPPLSDPPPRPPEPAGSPAF